MKNSAKENQTQSHKKVYLEVVRVIAVLLVILNHIDITNLYYHNTDNLVTFEVSLLVTILVAVDVPLFFMVSGATLLPKTESYPALLRKRVLRIVEVLLLFSLLQYLFQAVRDKIEGPSLGDFVTRFVSGNIQETYWFLYAYLGILLVLPVIRVIAQNLDQTGFLILLLAKLTLDWLFPTIQAILEIEISSSLLSSLNLIAGNALYMIMGYYIDQNTPENTSGRRPPLLPAAILLCFLIPALEETVPFLRNGQCMDAQVGSLTFLLTISIFSDIKNTFHQPSNSESSRMNRRISSLCLRLGSLTFGVYLTEQFCRALLLPLYTTLTLHTAGIVASLVYWAASALLAFGISFVLKKVPWVSRLI